MMSFISWFQSTQNRDRVFDRRLADVNRLETALQRCVLLDVLAILVECGCTNASQRSAGQFRLKQIRGIGRTFGFTRADHEVQFVDEQNDLTITILDFA